MSDKITIFKAVSFDIVEFPILFTLSFKFNFQPIQAA
jgi:hypothetical protein